MPTVPSQAPRAVDPPPKGADARILATPSGRHGLTGARLLGVLLIACAVAACLGSKPLSAWADHLPDEWDSLRVALADWDHAMRRIGATMPYETIHRRIRSWAETDQP